MKLKGLDIMTTRLIFEIKSMIYRILNIIHYNANYFKIKQEFGFMLKNQYKSIEYNTKIQRDRLFRLVKFAIININYYKNIVEQQRISISKRTILEDLKKFPILTKELIRKNWEDLHYDLKKMRYKLNTSGGTTGEPIVLIQDKNYELNRISGTYFTDRIAGYSLGDRVLNLWGDEREIIRETKGFFLQILNKFVKNTIFQNSFRMSERIMYNYVNEINKKRPKIIVAYTQSIYEIAKYIKRKNLKVVPCKAIITSAGDLSEELKKYLENTFKCRVFNRYGSREVGKIATSCERSSKLHINMYHQYIEILDENNDHQNANVIGDVVITNLTNYGMPLIRYKIGDKSSLDSSKCPCGRGLIRLENVYGRIIDIFINEAGDLIYGDFFTHLFYFTENLKQFQVIQEKINQIKISLVTVENNRFSHEFEKDLVSKIKKVMGENCIINFEYVNYINPSVSGKYRYTISNIYNVNLI